MISFLCYVVSPVIVAGIICYMTNKRISSNEANRRYFLWICGIIIASMIGLRHYSNGSGDSYFYYKLWQRLSTVPISGLLETLSSMDMEKGFLIFVWCGSHIFRDPQFCFVWTGMIFAVSICMFVNRNCTDVVLPLLAFNCLGFFNFLVQGMRQGLAICICLYALEACKQRKLRKFLIFILLAMTFHASAVLFIVVYWLYQLKLDVKSILLFVVVCIVGLTGLPYLVEIVNWLMNENYSIATGVNDGSGVVAIVIYFSIIAFAVYTAHLGNTQKEIVVFVYMAILGLTTLVMRNTIGSIAERVNYYFISAQMVLISESFRKMRRGANRTIIMLLVGVLCFGVALHKVSYSVLIPYRFFWHYG